MRLAIRWSLHSAVNSRTIGRFSEPSIWALAVVNHSPQDDLITIQPRSIKTVSSKISSSMCSWPWNEFYIQEKFLCCDCNCEVMRLSNNFWHENWKFSRIKSGSFWKRKLHKRLSVCRKERQRYASQWTERIEHEIKLKLSQFAAFCSILMDLFLTFDVKT